MWKPDLSAIEGPRYAALAQAISDAVRSGKLPAGARLPPQRALAQALGLNLTTVTRAYALAADMGVVSGEVGRGTYVRLLPDAGRTPWPSNASPSIIDLSSNFPASMAGGLEVSQALGDLRGNAAAELLRYQPSEGRLDHRIAGAQWLGHLGLDCLPDALMMTNGTIHGVFVSLVALCRSGDRVLVEELTSPAIISVCNTLNLRVEGIAMDENGIIPESLAAALAREPARALVLVPNLQNPTLAIMTLERRQAIANLLRRHGVVAVEDDAYGALLHREERPAPLATLAPERVCYVTSLSKAIAPGLRIGWLLPPPSLRKQALNAMRVSTWMSSPLAGQVATSWIVSRTAHELAAKQRQEAQTRQTLARELLGSADITQHPGALHLWLKLPEPWRAEEFAAYALENGVAVLATDSLAADSGLRPAAVRVSLCNVERQQLRKALQTLAQILNT